VDCPPHATLAVVLQEGKLAPQYDRTAKKEDRSLEFQRGWEAPDAKPVEKSWEAGPGGAPPKPS